MAGINLRKIRIGDSSELRSCGLMSGTLAVVEEDIRGFVAGKTTDVLIAQDENIRAVVKLFKRDRKKGTVQMEFVFTEGLDMDIKSEITDATLKYCFLSEYYNKVICVCRADDAVTEELLTAHGFIQEAILRDEIRTDSGFEDAGLFALTACQYPEYNVCFVPFERGIAVITGGTDYVDEVKLMHAGTKIEDPFVYNVAASLGFLARGGGIRAAEGDLYDMDEEQLEYLPAELAKAYVELTEYFANKRATFDIRYRFMRGTEFQLKVWKLLTSIPYGTTSSYEDIALKLCEGNRFEARKITRAVGAACSDNPISIIVPCHRVIGKDGNLVGYSAGLDIKDYLLLHESFFAVTPLITKEA